MNAEYAEGTAPLRITILSDSSARVGVGHVMRCVALAEELERKGNDVTWLADLSGIGWLNELLRQAGATSQVPEPSLPRLIDQVRELHPDVLIVDSYQNLAQPIQELRGNGIRIVGIVDEATPRFEADLYICPGPPVAWTDQTDSAVISGPGAILIRKALRQRRQPTWTEREAGSMLSIAVRLGGTDASGAAATMIRILSKLSRRTRFDVVPSTPGAEDALTELPANIRERFTTRPAGSDAFEAAADADIVISAAGVSAWEFACIGRPLILVQVAENQAANYAFFTKNGWAQGWGLLDDLVADKERAGERLAALLADRYNWREGAKEAWQAVDGLGALRAISEITDVVRSSADARDLLD
ncbi:MAG: hypothetical protein WCI74_08740 [Actinomycetes bacterium]